MRISEIFYSIQGEGKNIGMPAVFLRLAGCNLRCVWCDTEYSWNWEKYDRNKESIELSVDEVFRRVRQCPCRKVVITGGEPLLQQKELTALTNLLKRENYWIEIETNGTILPDPRFDGNIDQYNCSPKLKNSGHRETEMQKPQALKFFAASPKTLFKFVVAEPACHQEIEVLIENYSIPKGRAYLMPEGQTSAAIYEKLRWLAPLCLEHGLKLTDRLHIHLFGAKHGT